MFTDNQAAYGVDPAKFHSSFSKIECRDIYTMTPDDLKGISAILTTAAVSTFYSIFVARLYAAVDGIVLYFCNLQHVKDMQQYDLIPKKTLKMCNGWLSLADGDKTDLCCSSTDDQLDRETRDLYVVYGPLLLTLEEITPFLITAAYVPVINMFRTSGDYELRKTLGDIVWFSLLIPRHWCAHRKRGHTSTTPSLLGS